MDKLVSHDAYRAFQHDEALFAGLGGEAAATLAAASADIALVLSLDGRILDVSFRDRSLKGWRLEQWPERLWLDTVTGESRDKVGELLRDAAHWPVTPARQVNHAAPGHRDLPVAYRLVSFPGWPHRLALGEDLRPMAEMQQRFVRAQVEMEKDFRKLRDLESRYRVLFFLAPGPLLVVDGSTLKVLDANESAEQLFGRPVRKLAGSPLPGLFDKASQAALTDMLGAGADPKAAGLAARVADGAAVEIRVTPFREFGRTNLLVLLAPSGGQALPAVAAVAERARAAVEALPDGMVLVEGGGAILDANPAFLDLARAVSLERVRGRSLDNWLGGSSVDVQVLMANLREHGVVRRFSTVVRDELGGIEPVEVSASVAPSRDGPVYAFAIRESARGTEAAPSAMPYTAPQFTDLVGRVPLKDLVRDTADIIEKMCIEAALKLTDNNRASAADMLGLSRQGLYIKLKRFGIADLDPRQAERAVVNSD